jgi:sugar-specific transcriptional regulator TrmB
MGHKYISRDVIKYFKYREGAPKMKNDDFAQKLTNVGFSIIEASIYLTLLKEIKAKSLEEIVALTNIEPKDAESALRKLVNIDALKVDRNKFVALPPQKVLTRSLDEQESKCKDLLIAMENTISEITGPLQTIYWEKRLGIRPSEIMESLESLESMEIKTVEIIEKAKREIRIFAGTFGWYYKIKKSLINALQRGVRVKVLMIMGIESEEKTVDMNELGIDVKQSLEEWYPVRGTLVDDNEQVFLVWATKKEDVSKPIHYRPLYSTNDGLIKIFKDAFEKRWGEAKQI